MLPRIALHNFEPQCSFRRNICVCDLISGMGFSSTCSYIFSKELYFFKGYVCCHNLMLRTRKKQFHNNKVNVFQRPHNEKDPLTSFSCVLGFSAGPFFFCGWSPLKSKRMSERGVELIFLLLLSNLLLPVK